MAHLEIKVSFTMINQPFQNILLYFVFRGLQACDKILIKKLPILNKKLIRANLPLIFIPLIRAEKFIRLSTEYTSGSSGDQGVFYHDKSAFSKYSAARSLMWEFTGFKYGNITLQTGMTATRGIVKSIKDLVLRVDYKDAFIIDKKTVEKNLYPYQNKNNCYFIGYASSLYQYAKISSELKINKINFKAVISLGDKLFPHYRSMIENQFQTNVYDTYGTVEGLIIASQCEHKKYHIFSPHVYVELLDGNGKEVVDGEIGNVVVTCLDNFLMPLIRYDVGDLAVKKTKNSCKCGRSMPQLDSIVGRNTDIIYTPKEKALIVHFFTAIFEHHSEIAQFQVFQQNKGGSIDISYVEGVGFNLDILNQIKEKNF